MSENNQHKKGKGGWSSVWAAYRWRAKKKGFKWELTRAQFDTLLKQPCAYCGAEAAAPSGNLVTIQGVRYFYSGVDRRDNEPLYSTETVVSCCGTCNMAKGNRTAKEYIEHARTITTYSRRKARPKSNLP